MEWLLHLLDGLLSLAHYAVIGFNLCGWIWRRTRPWHRVSVGATILSWFVLGWKYGWGYCILTDWQWQVKRQLGETVLPSSFIKYAADRITGMDLDAALVDRVTLYSFVMVVVLTIVLGVRDYRSPGAPPAREV